VGIVVALALATAAFVTALVLRERAPAKGGGPGSSPWPELAVSGRVADSGLGRDGIPALDLPPAMAGADVARLNEAMRGKYLVSDDLVVGVSIGGASRAYPLRVLAWHEVANDVLGDVPIAVTYHPLSDAVVVLDRRTGGETLELGTSGLLHESGLVLYDRRARADASSLWSQLRAEAIAGPAAARCARLAVLPASLVRWEEWRALHPDSSVVSPDDRLLDRYAREPYGSYHHTRTLRYPVAAWPPPAPHPPWTHVLALVAEHGGTAEVHALEGATSAEIAPAIAIRGRDGERATVVAGPGATAGTVYALWWAWHAARSGPRNGCVADVAPSGAVR
jgi:hypothetical protein